MDVSFSDKAFVEYVQWQSEDKKTLKKINQLIQSIKRDGMMNGIGHPEFLKHEKGYSRKINEKDRLVYDGQDGAILRIISCKGHYDD